MIDIEQAPHSAVPRKFYPLVLCFFVGSGLAALIYEIVWFQLLEFIIGSTATSLAVLLGTFMGGMCLGSLALARIIPTSFHPLRVYAALELGIGLIAILVLYFLPPAADLYASIAGQGFTGISFRALLCAAFLLAPTVLMGATLPCAARWVENTPQGLGPEAVAGLYRGAATMVRGTSRKDVAAFAFGHNLLSSWLSPYARRFKAQLFQVSIQLLVKLRILAWIPITLVAIFTGLV